MTTSILKALDNRILDRSPKLREIASQIGGTPLFEAPSAAGGARIFAKQEWANPNGTVKDRAAFAMLYRLYCEHEGILPSSLKILEYTGGSLGAALSSFCHQLRIPLCLVSASFMATVTQEQIRAQGTDLIIVDKGLGFWAVMEKAFEISKNEPDYTFLYQHENTANPWIHRETTGKEILEQLALQGLGAPDAWVASIGTGGTLTGVMDALLPLQPNLKVFATTPSELPYGSPLPPNGLPKFSGSGGLGCRRKQTFVSQQEARLTGQLHFTHEECLRAVASFHKATGQWIGTSAAANWLAAQQVAIRLEPNEVVATIFPSLATESDIEQIKRMNLVRLT